MDNKQKILKTFDNLIDAASRIEEDALVFTDIDENVLDDLAFLYDIGYIEDYVDAVDLSDGFGNIRAELTVLGHALVLGYYPTWPRLNQD